MKKKFAIVFACLILAATLALTGCGVRFSKVKVENPQTDFTATVSSNGGNSVQYGNYIYFINGTNGYADDEGKNNVWGQVTKGALYRAKLADSPSASGMEFEFTVGEDYDGNPIDVVDVQLIAPKVIGTSGYANGGIFIYDEWVYYATPNNEKDKTGAVQVNKTDFFRTKLDGSNTQKIYTTDADSNTSPYSFQKWGDSVYMLAYFDSKIISVKMTGNKKPENPVTLAEDVTNAVLPYKATYNISDTAVTTSDYIFYQREATSKDSVKSGNVIEFISPDGKDGSIVIMLGDTETKLENVKDGMLFYRALNSSKNVTIYGDNVHNILMEKSEAYKNYQNTLKDTDNNKVISNIKIDGASSASMSNYTTTYTMRPSGLNSNVAYTVAISASAVYLFTSGSPIKTILNEAINFKFINGEYMYFTSGEATALYRTEWNKSIEEKTTSDTIKEAVTSDIVANGLNADICAGYIVYMGKVDEWANGYAMFKKIQGIEGAKEFFVGERIEDDIKPPEEEEEEEEQKGCGSIVGGSIAVGAISILALSTLAFIAIKRRKNA